MGCKVADSGAFPFCFDRNDTVSLAKVQDEWKLFPFQPEGACVSRRALLLFVAQRDDGVDFGGASRGDVAGEQRHNRQ